MVSFDELFGEASRVDPDAVAGDASRYLLDDEAIEAVYANHSTVFCFTDHRLFVAQREGMTQSRTDYHTIPYDAIRDFSVGEPGRFESEGKLRIWRHGSTSPMRYDISPSLDLLDLHRELSQHLFDDE